MREIMPYIWLAIIIFASIAGLNSRTRKPFLLVPAGLTVFLFSLSGTQVWKQVLLFFILAPALFILVRTFFKRVVKSASAASADYIAGASAIVTEEINNHKSTGAVRINGNAHTARAEENDIIYEPGLVVTVISFDGFNAVCSR